MNTDPNIGVVEKAVAELGDLTDEFLLIGGCAVGLLVTDPAATMIRPTTDVDVLTEVASLVGYYELGDRLKQRGFVEHNTSNVICRWIKGDILIDVVPSDASILGFTNTWYEPAAKSPVVHSLPSGRSVRVIQPPYFLATKLEAFAARAKGDFTHHDMEDIVTILDGRGSIVTEVLEADEYLRDFLREEFEALLVDSTFIDKLAWLLPPFDTLKRQPILLDRMRRIAGM